tara:strand:- start:103 stop:813 length:711 start_codon:yes stop_codon:yes gene_type:complete
MLLHTPITANQVTIFEYFLLPLGAIFLFFGNLEYIFIGLLIIHFTNLLDVVDGDIARYRKKTSLTGAHLEAIFDQLLAYFIYFPLAFGIFLQTGSKAILVVGFLCAAFAKSIIIPTMYQAVIASGLKSHSYQKQKSSKEAKSSSVNLQGSKMGKRINDIYEKFKDFWATPNVILILTIISIIELVNQYSPFMISYTLFYWYLVIFAVAAVFKQVLSFIVHYQGKATEQYYKALFGK